MFSIDPKSTVLVATTLPNEFRGNRQDVRSVEIVIEHRLSVTPRWAMAPRQIVKRLKGDGAFEARAFERDIEIHVVRTGDYRRTAKFGDFSHIGKMNRSQRVDTREEVPNADPPVKAGFPRFSHDNSARDSVRLVYSGMPLGGKPLAAGWMIWLPEGNLGVTAAQPRIPPWPG